MKFLFRTLLVILFIPLLAFVETPNNKYFEISKNLEIFTNLYRQLNTDYVDELDPGALMRISIDAMLEKLDPYTNYFSESQIESYKFQAEGKYDGLGAQTKLVDGLVTIMDMYETSPAREAGLEIGDQIISVDGNSTEDKSEDQVRNFLQGTPGSSFKVGVKREGEKKPLFFEVIRKEVEVTNVPYHGFVADDIGYVILTTFTADASQNLRKAINELKKENPEMKGLVFDLRSNGGGLLREAINVSNLFIDKDLEVVTTKGKVKERSRNYKTMNSPVLKDMPLAILTNGSTASASEIVSGVVQDYDRGIILGQRSYGKGLVQATKEIGYNAMLKVTTAKYYIPSGRCIQSVEYEGGEPKNIDDSLRSKFQTRNGRTVLDGGGILPDVEMPLAETPDILTQLNKEHIIFKYVNNWCLNHESIDDHSQFEFTEYEDFKTYVNQSGFTYESDAYNQGKLFLEKTTESIKGEVNELLAKIKKEDEAQLNVQRDIIAKNIQDEIVKRYYSEKEQVLYRLKNDPEVIRSIELLSDAQAYNDILK